MYLRELNKRKQDLLENQEDIEQIQEDIEQIQDDLEKEQKQLSEVQEDIMENYRKLKTREMNANILLLVTGISSILNIGFILYKYLNH